MDTLGLYLLKSVSWLSGFALVFLLFLKNERFFNLNRIYLLSGLIVSLLFPFVIIRYTVFLPAPGAILAGSAIPEKVVETGKDPITLIWILSLILYLSGAFVLLFLKVRQSRYVIRTIRNAAAIDSEPVRLIRTSDYTSSFSFFSYVFINPSITDTETREIMNHEKVHIKQKHWIDLVLAELLCIIQWFNPLVWIYTRFIKQNHEFLADEVALQSTSDPEVYKATLLNQIVGYPVVSLTNPFNYSLSKKRFLMMKNIITSPYRKMKVLFIIPVFAIILYSFATPEYKYTISSNNSGTTENFFGQQTKELKGIVLNENGAPLAGATIILRSTTTGTITDLKGSFKLSNVPDGAPLIVSYVGFKSKVIKPDYNAEMTIKMVRDTIAVGRDLIAPPPPPSASPPPPPPPSSVSKQNTKPVEVTGYGQNQFVVVERLPEFPGGQEAMMTWLKQNMKYPQEAVKGNITGNVMVSFVVDYKGKIGNVKTVQPLNPLLDAEAVRLISAMPNWTPGTQGGKPVEVSMKIPINFALH